MPLSRFENLEPDSRTSCCPKLSAALDRCRRVVTVEPVALLYFVSYMALFVTNEQYVYDVIQWNQEPPVNPNRTFIRRGLLRYGSNAQVSDDDNAVEADSANFLTIYGMITEIPGIVLAFFWGSYTDSKGRKPAMMMPLMGALLRTGCHLIVTANHYSINYLLIGAALDGLSGGPAVIMGSVFTYIADVTTEKQRSLRVTIVQSMVIVGLAVSQLGVGYMIDLVGYLYTFVGIAICQGLCLLYVMIWLKESITQKKKASFFTVQNAIATFKIFFKDNGVQRRWKLLTGIVLIFLESMIDIGGITVIILYILAPPFCFSSVQVGIYQVLLYGLQAVGIVLVLLVLFRVLGDLRLVVIGCVAGLSTYLFLGMPFINGRNVFLAPFISFLSGAVTPLVRSMMTKCCKPDEQGALSAGVVACIQGSQLLGMSVLGPIYASTVSIYAGLVFFIAAAFYSVALALAVYLMVRSRRQEQQAVEPTEKTPIQQYGEL